MILPNSLRAVLDSGKPSIGTHFMFSDPDIPELIGDLGLFDYGEYSAEYAAFDLPLLYNLARAAQAGGLPLMIKPDEGQGARNEKSYIFAGGDTEMNPVISGRRISTCMPIHAPKEKPATQQCLEFGFID